MKMGQAWGYEALLRDDVKKGLVFMNPKEWKGIVVQSEKTIVEVRDYGDGKLGVSITEIGGSHNLRKKGGKETK